MKRLFLILLSILLLCMLPACKINTPPTKIGTKTSSSKQQEKSTIVSEKGKYSSINITIPNKWEYKVNREKGTNDYSISFWPKKAKDCKIEMCYYGFWGVCGTFLKEEDITIGKYNARKGIYGDSNMWSFISFTNTAGHYVALNHSTEKSWKQYESKVMEILSTVKIAENVISEEQAIQIAQDKLPAGYNKTSTSFNTKNGTWKIRFSKKVFSKQSCTVTISHEGEIIETKSNT